MHKSAEFSIEVWPGVVRIHQGFDTEDRSTIELYPSQVNSFCDALRNLADEAQKLGDEFDRKEQEIRVAKSLNKKEARG